MDTLSILLFLGIPMIATVPVAMLVVRDRIARKQRVSYGTLIASASVVPFLMAVIATCLDPAMWGSREHKNVPELWFLMAGFMVAMCVLPALGVVVYYQRRRS